MITRMTLQGIFQAKSGVRVVQKLSSRLTYGQAGRQTDLLTATLVSLSTLLVYLPSLQSLFVDWDDDLYVYKNPFILSLNAVFLRKALFGFHASNWHPVTWLSHALDYSFWGMNPLGHHLASMLLHAINTFLVVMLVARLGRNAGWSAGRGAEGSLTAGTNPSLMTAAWTGLFFGLHPLHVESVAWVSERKDLLCALFILLALHAYAAYAAAAADRGAAGSLFPRDRAYLASLGFFALALMSKPMALSLPAVLLIIDWFPFGRVRSARTFLAVAAEKLPFFLLSLPSLALTLLAQRAGDALVPLAEIPAAVRSITAIRSLVLYVEKMVLPIRLVPYYPYPEQTVRFQLGTLLSAVVVVGASVAALVAARRGRRIWLAAWGWYVITLLPVLGFVQAGRQALADRYTYLPSLGPFLAAGAVLTWVWERIASFRYWRSASAVAALAAMLSLSALTVSQQRVWRDSISLWNAVIEREPLPMAFVYYNRAIAFEQSGRFSEALADYGRSIALDPGDERAFVNRGLLFVKTSRIINATADFKAACRLGNDFGCKAAQFYSSGGPPINNRK